jgi:hypothetical protein
LDIFKDWLNKRLPSRAEALPVFATLVFFVFTWALYRLAWNLPSWLYYLTVGEILALVAYVLAHCLVESLLIFGVVALLGVLLPPKIFREKFISMGTAIALLLSGSAILLQRKVGILLKFELWQVILTLTGIVVVMLVVPFFFALVFNRFPKTVRLLQSLGERMTIFAYLYVPLSLAGLFVVLLRNLG